MKRIKIAIAIMAVVVIAALGIFLLANQLNGNKTKREEAENQKLVIFDFDSDSIDKIDIDNETGNYVLELSNTEGWQMTNSDEFDLNASSITAICSNLCNLKASKILDDTDSSKYGFDNPIKITAYDGDTAYTLLIGDATPTYENFYVMKENDENIYLIDYTVGVVLCATKDALKQTLILNYMTSEIDHFCLWKGKETDENILFSMYIKDDGTWRMEKPYDDESVYNTQISTFLNDAIRDKIFSFVKEGCPESDYSKYGFDDPQYVMEVTAGDKHTKVIFGDYTNNENEMYGLFTDTEQIVTFIPNEIAAIGYDTMDMMNTSVFSADINDVTAVKVEMPDAEANLEINTSDGSYILDGTNVTELAEDSKTLYFTFYNSFNNAYFESIENDQQPKGDAEITITYTLSNNIVTKIEYIPIPGEDSNTYWALRDGDYTGFVVRKKVISNIISSYKELAEAVDTAKK